MDELLKEFKEQLLDAIDSTDYKVDTPTVIWWGIGFFTTMALELSKSDKHATRLIVNAMKAAKELHQKGGAA